jgi:hypothetical protein
MPVMQEHLPANGVTWVIDFASISSDNNARKRESSFEFVASQIC